MHTPDPHRLLQVERLQVTVDRPGRLFQLGQQHVFQRTGAARWYSWYSRESTGARLDLFARTTKDPGLVPCALFVRPFAG